MIYVSHRGNHTDCPENTMESFESAVELGVDGIETDIRLSLDHIPILYHDRIAPNGIEVANLSHKELCRIMGYEVPTLDQVLGKWGGILWNLEVKTPTAFDPTLQIINKYLHLSSNMLITSFWHPLVISFKKAIDVEVGFLLAHRPLELSFFAELSEIFQRDKLSLVWDYEILDEALIENSKKLGFKNWVYGIETLAEHRALQAMNVDGLITDYLQYVPELRA